MLERMPRFGPGNPDRDDTPFVLKEGTLSRRFLSFLTCGLVGLGLIALLGSPARADDLEKMQGSWKVTYAAVLPDGEKRKKGSVGAPFFRQAGRGHCQRFSGRWFVAFSLQRIPFVQRLEQKVVARCQRAGKIGTLATCHHLLFVLLKDIRGVR